MKNETNVEQPMFANIKRPMLWIAVGLMLFWGAVGVGIYGWVA